MEFWVNLGQITDVLSISSVGMVLPFLPNTPYAGAIRAIGRRPVSGIIGPADQTRALQRLGARQGRVLLAYRDCPHGQQGGDIVAHRPVRGKEALGPGEASPQSSTTSSSALAIFLNSLRRLPSVWAGARAA